MSLVSKKVQITRELVLRATLCMLEGEQTSQELDQRQRGHQTAIRAQKRSFSQHVCMQSEFGMKKTDEQVKQG